MASLQQRRETCSRRRGRAAARPAPVALPVLVGLVLQAAAALLGIVLGWTVLAVALSVLAVGLVVAVVAHRTVGSLAAGAALGIARPYAAGERVRLWVPSLRRVEDAEVVRVGPANTMLMTSSGLVQVPNSRMLRGTSEHPDARPGEAKTSTAA